MEVRLLTRWGSRFQGDIVSVSDERAKALEEAGYAKILRPVVEAAPVAATAKEPEPVASAADPEAELSEVKAKLDALGVSYSPRIGLEKAKAKLEEALSAK